MQFLFDGTHHIAIRITGPTYNLLGLRLGNKEPVTITRLPSQAGAAERVDDRDVLEQVSVGLAEINHELGTYHGVEAIVFLATDTPCTHAYRELTREIIARLHNQQGFTDMPNILETSTHIQS